jgi:hypothetical protein
MRETLNAVRLPNLSVCPSIVMRHDLTTRLTASVHIISGSRFTPAIRTDAAASIGTSRCSAFEPRRSRRPELVMPLPQALFVNPQRPGRLSHRVPVGTHLAEGVLLDLVGKHPPPPVSQIPWQSQAFMGCSCNPRPRHSIIRSYADSPRQT